VDIEPDHDELEEMLRRLAADREPVPPLLLQAAADAFTWRDIDGELAELVFDSALAGDEDMLVRGLQEQQRLVSFRAEELTIDVEVTDMGSARTVLGQVTPAWRGAMDIRGAQATVTVEVDELGRFQSRSLRAGPMSLRLSPAAGGPARPVVTEWVCI
jgi:hypothetical protein